MTYPTIKMKITPAPKLRGKMDVRFPANVEATAPILLDKSGGTYTFSFDANSLAGAFASAAQGTKADSAVQSVVAGTNVSVDNTDPQNPIVSATGSGSGDVSGPASSVDSEIVLFNSTTGKLIKRASTTGLLKGTSGVLSAATAGTDYYNPGGTDVAIADGGTGASTAAGARTNLGSTTVGDAVFIAANAAAARTAIGAGTIATQNSNAVTITGGSITGITDLAISDGGTGQSTAAAAFDALAPTTTRGDLIFRNASTNTRLAASTAGYHLQTNGAASDPTYVGFVQSGSSPSTRTWQDKARDFVNALDFGLVADASTAYSGTSASANATALMNALATGKDVSIPYNVNGYSFAGNTIALAAGQSIVGENQVLLKSQPATSGYFIHVTSFEVFSGPALIQNVTVDMTGSGSTSTALRFATASGSVYGVQLSQLLFMNCVEAIGDETHATNYVSDIKIYDVRALKTRGRQVYIKRSRGFIWVDTLRIDQTSGSGQTNTPTWASAQFDDIVGLEINRFDSVGLVSTTYQSAATGLLINGSGAGLASVWLNRILVDSSSGNGITVSNINYLHAAWIQSFQNLGLGIQLTNIARFQITNAFVYGGVGVTGATASAGGFVCNACTWGSVSNLLSNNNTGSGIGIVDSADLTLSNVQATDNVGFGVVDAGTSSKNLIIGGQFGSNTAGDISLSGANSRVLDYVASGSYVPRPVNSGGTGLSAGTSGGVPFYSSTSAMTSSALLALGQVVVGGGAGGPPATIANGQLPATATNDNASAGKLGEYISSNIAVGSAVSLTSATSANVTSISLTAGDWDVWFSGMLTGTVSTVLYNIYASISSTSATLDTSNGRYAAQLFNALTIYNLLSNGISIPVGPIRISLASTTTIYAVAQSTFTSSTQSAYGLLQARRAR